MPRWLKWTLGILAVLIIAIGAGYWWFIVDGSPPSNLTAKTIDIARVRAMADELAGPKATEVRVETIASMTFPNTAVVAGEGWDALPMGVYSYQLVFPDQTIVIDTALDEKGGSTLGATFHADAYARMDAAMAKATQIFVTHEHPDHLGGVLAYPDPDLLRGRLQLTREQVATAGRYGGFTVPPGVLAEVSAARVRRLSRGRAGRRPHQGARPFARQPDDLRPACRRPRVPVHRRYRLEPPQYRGGPSAGAVGFAVHARRGSRCGLRAARRHPRPPRGRARRSSSFPGTTPR